MFKQMKGLTLSGWLKHDYFVCPHCQHEIDVFPPAAAVEKTAAQFGVPFPGQPSNSDPPPRSPETPANPPF